MYGGDELELPDSLVPWNRHLYLSTRIPIGGLTGQVLMMIKLFPTSMKSSMKPNLIPTNTYLLVMTWSKLNAPEKSAQGNDDGKVASNKDIAADCDGFDSVPHADKDSGTVKQRKGPPPSLQQTQPSRQRRMFSRAAAESAVESTAGRKRRKTAIPMLRATRKTRSIRSGK